MLIGRLCQSARGPVLARLSHLRLYQRQAAQAAMADQHIVDLRSDTVTQPTPLMREAMLKAVVGDDVYGEDPTINELQERCAALLGKEAALLVPTGTMGNLIAVMTHCQSRFTEALVGDKSHMLKYEVANMAQLGGVQQRTVTNFLDGTMDLQEARSKIRARDDVHLPWTRLICVENTHNVCGGKVLPLSFLKEVRQLADENDLKVHMDGARVLNAAVALGVPPAEIVKHVDSVMTCFSKGLAAPIGSILAGGKKFIESARWARKALGGGMRQAGVLAAAMLVSLDTILPRLHEDHTRARVIAEGVESVGSQAVQVSLSGIHSNIVMLNIAPPIVADLFCQRLQEVTEAEKAALGESIVVRMLPFSPTTVRYVTHNDISDADVEKAVKKLQFVLKEMSP